MKIAQISPLYESVPPKLYGGTERVVSYLTEELINQGHEVTLFASGDSITKAKLIAPCTKALRLDPDSGDTLAPHFVQLKEVIDHYREFDVLHFHTDYLHFPVASVVKFANLTTLHGRLDLKMLEPLYKKYKTMPLVSISNSQRTPLPWVNWIGTVYHGLPANQFKMGEGQGDYLAFIGRISPEKGVEDAIAIAKKAGMKIRVAAKIDKVDHDYYKENVAHLFKDRLVEYIGEINEQEKQEFLGNAKALLFPINWPEPFGLVMIESMATGTPVIGFKNGSVPEVIDEGKSGNIVSSIDEAVEAVKRLDSFDRMKVRQTFESRFTAEIMAKNYLRLYHLQVAKFEEEKFSSVRVVPNHHSDFSIKSKVG